MKLLKTAPTPPLAAISAVAFALVSSVTTAGAAGIDARAYITDGLVVHFDGIDNTGTGVHDSSATNWVDLSGNGHDASRPDGQAILWAGGNSMVRPNGTKNDVVKTGDITLDLDSSVTFDFCGVQPAKPSESVYILQFAPSGKTVAYQVVNKNWQAQYSGAGKTLNSGDDFYSGGPLVSYRDGNRGVHYDVKSGRAYTNENVVIGTEGAGTGPLCLASHSNGFYSFLGTFHGLRIYNRPLTATEIKWNTAVDKVRFFGASSNETEVAVENLPAAWGLTGVPALGSTTTLANTDDFAISLDGLSAHPDDGVLSREYATGCRARFHGWSYTSGMARLAETATGTATNGVVSVTNLFAWLAWDVRNELKAFVSARTGGKVRVAGGAAAASGSCWIEEGVGAVAIEAVPDAGYEFVSWTGDVSGLASVTSAVTTCSGLQAPASIAALFRETHHTPVTLNWKPGVRSGDFNDPACWTEGVIPQTGDTLCITNIEAGDVTILVDAPTPRLAKIVISNPYKNNKNVYPFYATLSMKNWSTCLAADEIVVERNGRIASNTPFHSNEMSNRVWVVANTLTVTGFGNINADNGGYKTIDGPCWRNPDGTFFTSVFSSGGVYGAPFGGELSYSYSTWQHPYGSDEWPFDPGSGSGDWRNGGVNNGPGGGAVFLDVSGDVTVDGTISANASISGYAPGSGGSVLICCRAIKGSGTISATASTSAVTSNTKCGGSGRIAVHYNPSVQSNTVCAVGFNVLGGIGDNLGYAEGSVVNKENDDIGDYEEGMRVHLPGTIWFSDNQFLLHSEAYRTAGYPFKGTWKSGEPLNGIHWTGDRTLNGTRLYFDRADFPFTIDGNLTLVGTGNYGRMIFGLIFTNSQVTVNGNLSVTNSRMQLIGGKLTVAGDVETGYGAAQKFAGGEIALFAMPTNAPGQFGVEAEIGGTLHLSNYSVLAPFSEMHNGAVPHVSAKNVIVDAGGKIDADTKGYDSCYGPGAYKVGPTSSRYGSAYGGQGGVGTKGVAANRTQPCGDMMHPLDPGSGNAYAQGFNARGGGLVYMDVSKRFLLNGLITADGNRYNVGHYGWASGSSGGGVYIRAKHFGGTGTIRARGGFVKNDSSKDCYPAAGGGGRVAIWSRDVAQLAGFAANQVDVSCGSAWGNPEATGGAGDGTVYLGLLPGGMITVVK